MGYEETFIDVTALQLEIHVVQLEGFGLRTLTAKMFVNGQVCNTWVIAQGVAKMKLLVRQNTYGCLIAGGTLSWSAWVACVSFHLAPLLIEKTTLLAKPLFTANIYYASKLKTRIHILRVPRFALFRDRLNR